MKKNIVINLLFAAGILMSCREEIIGDTNFSPEINIDTTRYVKNFNSELLKRNYVSGLIHNEIVVSDTLLKYMPVKLHQAPGEAPDLTALKSTETGNPLEYIAMGSSLTAGVRDGGYTNEGMLTAYPALIARQMRLANFESPLFDEADFNGAGRKVITGFNPTRGPVRKFSVAANNLAIEGYDDKTKNVILKKSKTPYSRLHNLAIPELGFEFLDKTNTRNKPYIKRMTLNDGRTPERGWDLLENIKERKVDFFTLEMGSQAFGGDPTDINYAGEKVIGKYLSWEQELLEKYERESVKGVVVKLPCFWDFPFYNQFSCELIEKNSYGVYKVQNCYPERMMGSGSGLDSLASPVVSLDLKRKYSGFLGGDFENDRDINTRVINRYNSLKEETSKKYGFPTVDLHKSYEQILKGQYVTHDGIKVDPSWPAGNFFSQDGIFPTAFGHAVIANEIIRVINENYKTQIPLINTREYLK